MSHEFGRARKIFSGIKGYDYWMKTVIRINQFDKNEVAKYRLKVITHYRQFGLASTLAAFPVKRSTLYLWQQKLKASQGKLLALKPHSTRPKRVRQMRTDPRIVTEIERLRRKHYRLGKQKLKPLLDAFCHKEGLVPPSTSLIGKVIKRHSLFFQRDTPGYHDPNRKQHQFAKKLRVNKAPRPQQGGYIQADTIETIVNNVRRYTISFIDVKLKVSHSKTFTGKLAKYALEVFRGFEALLPVPAHTIQTDNGSEFAGEFDRYLRKRQIKHLWTYPNCPKINGCIERYNRSLQEEWLYTYLDEIDDVKRFNKRLREYLYFYNNRRVHESLNLQTPAQVVGKELKSPICV